ncbi:putative O-methyltransferase YrrM [Bacillus sp. SLBN-46]|uniref:O-methyltransferase n=1 Tax=Bacillus sp. SLBN-46 TaxID=3042283 RepID=UPI0028653C6A|nr:O-methyltransferase [Bacillus sp. SLBN-46]MDR6123115.1 putative O-methyltransferase YrrM [Bacillus sp. SLBN-46]
MNKELAVFLKELENFGVANDQQMKDKSKRMRNVTPETGRFLSFIATTTQARNILEIGTSNGYSTLWLAESVSENDGHVTTLEFLASKAELAKSNFEKAKMSKWIDLIVMNASEYIHKVESNTVDMIFLDSDRKEYVEWWGDLSRILKKNGLIVVDNVISHSNELQDFYILVSNDENYKTIKLPIESGLLLLTKK